MEQTGYRQLRKGRASIPGHYYLLTTVCQGRRRLFADWTAASTLAAALAEDRLWHSAKLVCWVVMPDHMHVIVELGEEGLPGLMRRVKAVTALAINRALERRGSAAWLPGYQDRALRSNENLRDAARYVVENPVRAGLVSSVAAYPFWDADWL